MAAPFFSILVPVYNVESYLNECLETLTNQTFTDYEIILVDDGSTDGSGLLCDRWQERFPQSVHVIHQRNQGLVMARSTAMRNAQGAYFLFVDSDDVLRRDALEVITEYIRKYDADMVIYDFSDKEDFSQSACTTPFRDGEIMSIQTTPEFRRIMGSTFLLNNLWRKAVKRSLVQTDRDYSDVAHIRHGEDLMFSLPMVDRARCVVYCGQILYYYRPTPNSMTKNYYPGMFRSQRDTLRIQRQYARKWDPDGTLVQECDTNGLWHFFDDVLVSIIRADCSGRDKRRYILEMVEDGDFQRNYQYIGKLRSLKERICLRLIRNRCFWPLLLYGDVKNRIGKCRHGQ